MRKFTQSIDKTDAAVLAGALLLFLPFCGSYGMWDPWETHYGEAARQMLVRGDFWTLYWEDAFFFSKPILLFWMMGASFSLFGVTEFAARLPVALAAVAAVFYVYRGLREITGRSSAGILAAAAVASTPLYTFIGRQCITDMPFVASMTIALVAFLRFELSPTRRARHIYAFYFFCGLAMLAKGPLGLLLPGAIVCSYMLFTWDFALLKRVRIPTGGLVFLLVAGPWYGTMLALHGERFFNEFFLYNNVKRATGSGVHGARPDYFYYFRQAQDNESGTGGPVFQAGTFPWLALLPAALLTYLGQRVSALTSKKEAEPTTKMAWFFVLWFAVSLVLFSSIPTKFNHYLLPLAPAVAILAALWIDDVIRKRIAQPTALAGLLVAGGIAGWFAIQFGAEPWRFLDLFIYQYGRSDFQRFEVGSVYLYGGLAIAGTFVACAFVERHRLKIAGAGAAVAVALAAYNVDHYLVEASDCASQQGAFTYYEAERRPGDQLINYRMNYRGEAYYGKSEAVKAIGQSHLRWLLSRTDRSFIVANRHVFGGLSAALRRITGQDPHILNPESCNTRMVLYDGPPVRPPNFRPAPGDVVDAVPDDARREVPARVGSDVTVLGQRVRWVGSGRSLRADVTLYLRCERDTDEWWKVFMHGENPDLPGRRQIIDHTAVSDRYPSVVWEPGQILVHRERLNMGWLLEFGEGRLRIAVGLFHDETRAAVTPESENDGEDRLLIATYQEGRPQEQGEVIQELPSNVQPLAEAVQLNNMASLLAFELNLSGQGRHSTAEVVLYLRADERTEEPWQIFVHGVSSAGRREVSDHHPVHGGQRTTTWEPGSIVVDRTVLDLGRMAGQEVDFHFGMFHGDQRARIAPESSDDGSRRVSLGSHDLGRP